ncbi:monooxygenase family protein [Micromonospora sp. NPDC049359]|uniref:monooxygenase family protein n=1 Tax=Micromonospora sp. NPDC049359 TaxID=3364270 RepID=UPI00378CB59B
MNTSVNRQTVDLSPYPDLVVVYLGMRVNRLFGLRTLMGYGPQIGRSASDNPEGLLRHEPLLWSLFPMHVGIRQYWRDLPSLLSWARSEPHRIWWRNFLRDSGGTGFWHETYLLRGGMEAVYDDIPKEQGFAAFAPVHPARGPLFSSAARVGRPEDNAAPVISEDELYTAGPGQ